MRKRMTKRGGGRNIENKRELERKRERERERLGKRFCKD